MLLVGACGESVVISDFADQPSVLTLGFQPTYVALSPHVITPTSCLAPYRSGYGSLPARCNLDRAFGSQIANAGDVAHPRDPGPPSAIPAARAAEAYIFGDEVGVSGAGAGGGAGQVEVAPVTNGERAVAVPAN